jgi:hypothetical protein
MLPLALFSTFALLHDASANTRRVIYADADGDGWGDPSVVRYSNGHTAVPGYTHRVGDCDDTDAHVRPGAIEHCNDRDDDCDGFVDDNCDISLDDAALVVGSNAGRTSVLNGPLAVADLNADGTGDLVVGSDTWDGGVYVLYGPLSGGALIDDAVKIGTTSTYDWFGASLGGGDADGDGFDDLLVGAPNRSPSTTYLFLGPVTSDRDGRDADAVLTSRPADYTGLALLVTADHDGDGEADAVVGAAGGGGDYEGAAYVVPGTSTGAIDLEADATYIYEGEGVDFVGYAVADLGDANGDGISDLAIGAPWNDDGIFIVDGGSAPGRYLAADVASATVTGGDDMGRVLQTVDYDGDGTLDLVTQDEPTREGGVRAFLGPFIGRTDVTDATASWEWTSASGSPALGGAFAAEDFDGDGETDLIIGAYGNYDGNDSGAVFFQWGIASGVVDVGSLPYITGSFDGARLGGAVVALPDWNGDGIPEVAIEARYSADSADGKIYGFFSGSY